VGGGAIPHPEKETLMSDKINGTEVVTENFCVRNKITFDDVKSFVGESKALAANPSAPQGEIVNTLADQDILNKRLLSCALVDASGEEEVELSVEDVVKHVTAPVPIPPVSYVTGSFDVAVGETLAISSANKAMLKPAVPDTVKIDPKFLVSALGFYVDGTEAGTIAEIGIVVEDGVLTGISAPAALTDATTVRINILLSIYQDE
jgi:hypothetical protein